ncbi:hypothetical protein [Gordonia malaquae]|uniref:hypothetical protein n=1 Tax=Gordonia malaquae TaxID=410332 RepID=UPI0030198918
MAVPNLGTHLADVLLRAKVWGLATPPGEPPLQQAQLSITGDDADLAIPVLQGEPGPPGTAAAPFLWQFPTLASAGELPTLAAGDKGKAWVISDGAGTGDIAYWTGTEWRYFVDAFGPGLPGPAPDVTATGELVAEADPFEVEISGPAAAPNLHFKIPGTPGPPGPGGAWSLFDASVARPDGAVPVWDADTAKFVPATAETALPRPTRYTLPESAFTAYAGTAASQTVATMPLPVLPYPFQVDVTGHAKVGLQSGSTAETSIMVRIDDPTAGQLVAKSIPISSGAAAIGPHHSSAGAPSAAAAPGGATGLIPAHAARNLVVVATRVAGSGGWTFAKTDAQLRVLIVPEA